ncbi:response regulator [Christiangramia fulva]|uniref:Response regulator n=1 Tax=Christiangramia fulva TaxID=2126553 RepID=A0A2R3Z9A6_9FLAO|nr:response regulator [Christiangramia fulva]AVR46863.1 response regulator [Christiangramia fulva]
MIKTPLRILLVEDNEVDAGLIKRQLGKIAEKSQIEVTDTLTGCREFLINFAPDVVLSDYNLPGFTGLDVLEMVKEFDEELPLIFVTGTINDEELAAHTILSGASGYILKKHMKNLAAKLEPFLKKVVVNMTARDEVRERIRNNRITVNQIHEYLAKIDADNAEQVDNIEKIKQAISRFKIDDNAE